MGRCRQLSRGRAWPCVGRIDRIGRVWRHMGRRKWRSVVDASRHEREVDEARRQMEEKLERARQVHEAKWEEHRTRHSERIASALVMRSMAEGTELVRLILREWANDVVVRKETLHV